MQLLKANSKKGHFGERQPLDRNNIGLVGETINFSDSFLKNVGWIKGTPAVKDSEGNVIVEGTSGTRITFEFAAEGYEEYKDGIDPVTSLYKEYGKTVIVREATADESNTYLITAQGSVKSAPAVRHMLECLKQQSSKAVETITSAFDKIKSDTKVKPTIELEIPDTVYLVEGEYGEMEELYRGGENDCQFPCYEIKFKQ